MGTATSSDRVRELVQQAVEAAAFCRDWRNRRIAHTDLDLVVDAKALPLASASHEQVSRALHAIVEVLNAVSSHFDLGTSYFDLRGHPGDAVSLLHVLDDGLRARTEARERLQRGEPRESDYLPRTL